MSSLVFFRRRLSGGEFLTDANSVCPSVRSFVRPFVQGQNAISKQRKVSDNMKSRSPITVRWSDFCQNFSKKSYKLFKLIKLKFRNSKTGTFRGKFGAKRRRKIRRTKVCGPINFKICQQKVISFLA